MTMMNIKALLKNKFLVTAIAVSLVILIVVALLSPKKNVSQNTPSSSLVLSDLVPADLSKEKRTEAIIYTDAIEGKLPLREESFDTSVGITTQINISRTNDDPAEIVHLDINGLSYLNKNELDETKNPNVTAFKESYLHVIEMLESQNIDPKRLIFVYSDQPYVRETASDWINKLKL